MGTDAAMVLVGWPELGRCVTLTLDLWHICDAIPLLGAR